MAVTAAAAAPGDFGRREFFRVAEVRPQRQKRPRSTADEDVADRERVRAAAAPHLRPQIDHVPIDRLAV